MTTYSLFQYIRGALRGAYGLEELRGKRVLVVGLNTLGQDILLRLCLEGVKLYFLDSGLYNYYCAYLICPSAVPYRGEAVHLLINLEKDFLMVNEKQQPLKEIGEEPYTQGIHDFYI